jgi:hypothetical protein
MRVTGHSVLGASGKCSYDKTVADVIASFVVRWPGSHESTSMLIRPATCMIRGRNKPEVLTRPQQGGYRVMATRVPVVNTAMPTSNLRMSIYLFICPLRTPSQASQPDQHHSQHPPQQALRNQNLQKGPPQNTLKAHPFKIKKPPKNNTSSEATHSHRSIDSHTHNQQQPYHQPPCL